MVRYQRTIFCEHMRKTLIPLIVILLGIAGFLGWIYYKHLRGIGPVITSPPADISDLLEPAPVVTPTSTTGMPVGDPVAFPLKLPKDFTISIFAKNLPNARVMAWDGRGNLWVSRTKSGAITMLDIENGKVVGQADIFTGLQNPHGIVFDYKNPDELYIAEEHRVSRVLVYRPDVGAPPGSVQPKNDIERVKMSLALYSAIVPHTIAELPGKGGGVGHYTRTIAFGPDDRLYVSIGSSCNVCNEEDNRRAKIFTMNRDGSNLKEFAKGLRNTVFFTWSYVDGRMWGTDMGRDLLGDDIPPDEINILEEGKNYGWPICYGKNIHDTNFDKNTYIRNPCMEPFETPSHIDLQAHSAPLGLAFVPEEGWPEEYWYNLFVAFHGSWNRSEPTGYSIARIKLDAKGNYLGGEDFISGWLTEGDKALGRPVDIMIQPGGTMYISDDRAGVIYQVRYTGQAHP